MNTITKTEAAHLDALASRIHNDIDQISRTREDWVATTLDLAAALAEAREHFKADQSFSRWLDENKFLISKDDRAALIAFGQDIERARLVLGQTESRSVRIIYQKEFRFRSAAKPAKPANDRPSPKKQVALDAYDALKAAGIAEPTRNDVMERAGVGDTPARFAITQRKAEAAVLGQDPGFEGAPKSWATKYERAIKRKIAQLEAEFDKRRMEQVQRHINEYLMPFYREKLEKADRILSGGLGKRPFTVDEFRQLLAALHPDSLPERRAKMFALVKDREYLLRPPERDKPLSGDLAMSLDELMKRKRQRDTERKHK